MLNLIIKLKEGKLLLDMNRNVSNERAKTLLGWEPIATQEEAILAAVIYGPSII